MRLWGGEKRSEVEREKQDKEKKETEGAREQGHSSGCQGIDVSLQLSSVTSAIKSPSNCSLVPKHLGNAQLMSIDAVSHWFLTPPSADLLVRQGERKERREEEEMATCNRKRIIAPIGPRVGVRPRVINSTACDGAQQVLCSSVYPTHQFNYDS